MAMLQQGHRRRTIHHNPRRMYVCIYLPIYLCIYLSDKQRQKNHLVHRPSPTSPSHHSPPQSPSPALSNFLTYFHMQSNSKCHRHNSTPLGDTPNAKIEDHPKPPQSDPTSSSSLTRSRLPTHPIPSHPTPKAKNFGTHGGRRPQPKLLNPLPHPTQPNRIESIPAPKQSVTAQDPRHRGQRHNQRASLQSKRVVQLRGAAHREVIAEL